jgi:hypothetical protein
MATTVSAPHSTIVYLLLGILMIGATLLSFIVIGCGQTSGPQSGEQAQDRDVYTRSQFQELIMGKTEAEVLQELGRPKSTSEHNGVQYWHYGHRTKDPLTQEIDGDAQVVFENGRVRAINY